MADSDAENRVIGSGALAVDPFSFHQGVTSRIAGLGGSTPGYDTTYAFHTSYVEAAPGVAHFTLRFTGLTARRGTLHILVYMLPLEEGAHARVVNTDRIQFNRLVRDQEASIRFDAFKGVSFALHGKVIDETDAEAQALTVLLDRPADPDARQAAGVEARSSHFGRDTVKPAAHMIAVAPPILAYPVSQMCTTRQLKEKGAQQWIGQLDLGKASPLRQWSAAYILQVLSSYGMMAEGAVGLGLGQIDSAIPTVLADNGLRIVTAVDGEAVSDPTAAGDTGQTIDFRALPGPLLNFDFVWSEDAAGRQPTVATALDWVERCMGCLRPGGLAIHLFPYNLDTADPRIEGEGGTLFQRNDMERLSLTLISRKFEVAQMKVDATDAAFTTDDDGRRLTCFGLIARRPPSAY